MWSRSVTSWSSWSAVREVAAVLGITRPRCYAILRVKGMVRRMDTPPMSCKRNLGIFDVEWDARLVFG